MYDARLQRNFVVQVILTDKSILPPNAITTTTSEHLTTINDHSNTIPIELPHSSVIEQT